MAERPIPFSEPMVKALLAGTKVQTRRLVKPQPPEWVEGVSYANLGGPWWDFWATDRLTSPRVRCPYGQPGDFLYVKEGWGVRHRLGDYFDVVYRADGADSEGREVQLPDWDGPEFEQAMRAMSHGWRSSRFMPKWAARLWLEIVEVRCERVNAITDDDAIAEGLLSQVGDGGAAGAGYKWTGVGYHGAGFDSNGAPTFHTPAPGRCSCKAAGPSPAVCAFRELWDSINGKRAPWSSNPHVWVISFRRVKDAVAER